MRRRPSPWFALPVVVAAITGGVVGGLVTQVSCAPNSCTAAAVGIGLLSALVSLVGVGVVVILAMRSIAEWRESPPAVSEESEDRGPPTC
jgi:hypothetical protein